MIVSVFINVHFLNGCSVVIDDVAFIGATLWTDVDKENPISSFAVEKRLKDYHIIRTIGDRPLRVKDTVETHNQHKSFIFDEISVLRPLVRKTVVVSHHAPSGMSVHPRFRGNALNAGFYSEMSDEIHSKGPDVWFHGHTHDTFQYKLGNTTVACNPRGYASILSNSDYLRMKDNIPVIDLDESSHGSVATKFLSLFNNENSRFNPFFVVEV